MIELVCERKLEIAKTSIYTNAISYLDLNAVRVWVLIAVSLSLQKVNADSGDTQLHRCVH